MFAHPPQTPYLPTLQAKKKKRGSKKESLKMKAYDEDVCGNKLFSLMRHFKMDLNEY